MCMITFCPPNVKVPASGIHNGGSWNDDGHGWAVAADIGLMLTGHSMDLDEALDRFLEVRKAFPQSPALFHSRWATHGTKGLANCHPFYVAGKAHAGNVVVAHNGILPGSFHPGKKDTRSDTAILAEEWLGRQTAKGTWTRKERKRIGSLIGQGNKLAILSVSPVFDRPRGFLVNGHRGEWVKGAWFSNGDHASYWTRGRYTWSSSDATESTSGTGYAPATSYGAYGKGVKRYEATRITPHTSMFGVDDECPWCYSKGHIDLASNTCLWCDTCLDCMDPVRDCLCYGAEAQREASQREDESAAYAAEHGSLDMSTGDVALGDSGADSVAPSATPGKTLSVWNGGQWS